jgi:hypothetical protein
MSACGCEVSPVHATSSTSLVQNLNANLPIQRKRRCQATAFSGSDLT